MNFDLSKSDGVSFTALLDQIKTEATSGAMIVTNLEVAYTSTEYRLHYCAHFELDVT